MGSDEFRRDTNSSTKLRFGTDFRGLISPRRRRISPRERESLKNCLKIKKKTSTKFQKIKLFVRFEKANFERFKNLQKKKKRKRKVKARITMITEKEDIVCDDDTTRSMHKYQTSNWEVGRR